MTGHDTSGESSAFVSERIRFPARLRSPPAELALRAAGIELAGLSLGAVATAFAVDAWKVAVDMGRCTPMLSAQDSVLLTHCHSDHLAGLVAWLSSRTRISRTPRTRVFVPVARRAELLAMLRTWPDLDRVRRRLPLDEVVVGVRPDDEVRLAGGWARAFATHHTVPSLGWQLGASGEKRPRLVFTGDSTIEPFRARPELLDAAIAVVDCSLLEPGARVVARLSGHSHLLDWRELAGELSCDNLVFCHLPADMSTARVRQMLHDFPAAGPVLIPWMAEPPVE